MNADTEVCIRVHPRLICMAAGTEARPTDYFHFLPQSCTKAFPSLKAVSALASCRPK
jgi:hypothetical protein